MTLKTTLLAILLAAAGSGQAQQVEYVTRNVQPTDAVRFNSQPVRITITDRGERVGRGDLEPVTHGTRHNRRQTVLYGGGTRLYGFGGYVRRPADSYDSAPVSLAERNRSRTVYGSELPADRAESSENASRLDQREAAPVVQDPAARAAAEEARDERRQRLYDRLLPLIEARRQEVAEEQANERPETTDDDALSETDDATMMPSSE